MEDTRLQVIEKLLDRMEADLKDVKGTLTGDLNCEGILTTLAVMKTKMEALELLTTNHLSHLNEKFDLMITSNVSLQAVRDEDHIGWNEFAKEWVKPVITAIVIGLIMYLINRL